MSKKIILVLGLFQAILILPLIYGVIMLFSGLRHLQYPHKAQKDFFKVEKIEKRKQVSKVNYTEWADGYRLSDSVSYSLTTKSFGTAPLQEGTLQTYLSRRDSIIPVWKIHGTPITVFRRMDDDRLGYDMALNRLRLAGIAISPFIILLLINYVIFKFTPLHEK